MTDAQEQISDKRLDVQHVDYQLGLLFGRRDAGERNRNHFEKAVFV